ncbi:TonB-dependent receptor [Salinibacter ruber]|uniref:TonB-dependent receptor n=1 Tax=Salinibacter ruber TaxID=146919 RepID=UPI00216754C1|nr:TonB-dependent receptor [Salinibacter ruber]MCS3704649.1 iron complex outermembrane receptor protein/hemoglobin/transferrin/lactoferrin receptor protein [Salinibacter ruber]
MSTRILVVLALLTFVVPIAEAQSTRSTVTGTVTDADGAPLPGAQIADVAFQRGTTAGPDGRYTLDGLPPGTHTLEIRFVGYQTAVREVTLQAGETREINVSLKERVLETDGVTVTGTARARSTLRAPQDVDVMGTEDLQSGRSAALGELLQENVDGVSSIQTGAQAGKPVLRGLSGKRVVLLKDGIAQEYYQFGVRHFPTTNASEAERVEVVRGASSILYGSDALGGAINVISKPAPTTGVDAFEVGGSASTQYYTNNNERAVALDLSAAQGNVGWRVGAERRIAGNYHTPDAPTFSETKEGGTFGDPRYTGEVPFTNFEQWSTYGQVGLQGAFGTLQLYGDYWSNAQNFLLPAGGTPGQTPFPAAGLGQNLEHSNVVLKGNIVADGFVLKPRLSWQRSIRQSGAPGTTLGDIRDGGGLARFDYPLDLKTDIYTGRLEVAHPSIGSLSGTIGAEVQHQDANTRGPAELQPSARTWNTGVFFFEDLDLDPVTVSFGSRLDVRTVEAVPNDRTTESDQLDNTYTTLSGAVGASYAFSDGVAIATNLSSGFRAPSVFELYASGVHGGVAAFQVGNPDLEPERSYSADLSLRVRRDRVTAEVTGYVNAIQDYIYLENTPRTDPGSGLPVFEADQTDALIPGVEAKIEASPLPWLQVGGSAAVLDGTGDGLGADEGDDGELPLLPANTVSGFVRWVPADAGPLTNPQVELSLKRALDKDAAGRFESFSQFDEGFGPPFGTASTRAYSVVNVEARTTLALGLGAPLTVSVGVDNLLDETYRDFLDTYKGYALSPGRDVQFSLSTSF